MTDYAVLPPKKDGDIFVPKITLEENAYRKGQMPTPNSIEEYVADPLYEFGAGLPVFALDDSNYQPSKPSYHTRDEVY